MRPITVNVGPLGAASATAIVGNALPAGPAGGGMFVVSGTPPGGSFTTQFQGQYTITNGVLTVTSTTSGAIAAGMLIQTNGLLPNTRVIGPGPTPGTWIVYPTQTVAASPSRGNPVSTFDAPRQVFVTTTEAAGNSITIIGTDAAGNTISETLATNGGNLTTSQSFKTVTQAYIANTPAANISIGTTTSASSAWVMFDPYVSGGYISKQTVVNGVANYTVQLSYDDPNAPGGPAPGAMGWLPDSDATFVGATTSLTGSWPYTPLWARVLLNSGAGSVRATFIQPGNLGR